MSEASWVEVIVGAPCALLALYAAVRVAAAAWYKSKSEFDNQPKGR